MLSDTRPANPHTLGEYSRAERPVSVLTAVRHEGAQKFLGETSSVEQVIVWSSGKETTGSTERGSWFSASDTSAVVDENNVVLGVVAESDFMIKERGREHVSRSPLRWLLGEGQHDLDRVNATTAGGAMTAPAITIEGRMASLREAAMTMAQHRINRLPVTESGNLVGIITRADLLRVYTRTDEAIEEAVREVLRDPGGVEIGHVRDGVVRLSVAGADGAAIGRATRAVETVDGVVAVEVADARASSVATWTSAT